MVYCQLILLIVFFINLNLIAGKDDDIECLSAPSSRVSSPLLLYKPHLSDGATSISSEESPSGGSSNSKRWKELFEEFWIKNPEKSYKVILADDNKNTRKVFFRKLKSLFGAHVSIFVAEDGGKAAELYRQNEDVAFILMDFNMGGDEKNGNRAVYEIRSLGGACPIFSISDHEDRDWSWVKPGEEGFIDPDIAGWMGKQVSNLAPLIAPLIGI